MYVHRSNRVEVLLDALASVLAEPPENPLEPEPIVVHSRGLARWLSLRLAERFGVWTGNAFPFPRHFLQDIYARVLGRSGPDPFGPAHLRWAILRELPQQLEHPAFAELVRYLAHDDGRNRFALADRIARLFDQYAVFRPELVSAWERGRDDDWQARLWRALAERAPLGHDAAAGQALLEALARPGFEPGVLPSRVCLFGLSSLPPLYLRLLAALSAHTAVHLFAVSPSAHWWGEMRTPREARREAARRARSAGPVPPEDAPPLLVSLGPIGRDFQSVLEAEADYQEPEEDRYVDPLEIGPPTMLAMLQSDLLHLRRRGVRGPASPLPIDAEDRSISVHACHSAMREVEVLHDQLLACFDADPRLRPRDVVVMMSDVETYAPLVEAVFGPRADGTVLIPHCIADRPVRGESPVLEALHRVLGLAGGRATASAVLDLLSLEPVARRFGIESRDLDRLTAWVAESGIRWGIDAEHRQAHEQPELGENTWRFGLQRLFLGYAMPGEDEILFERILPYDEVEGQEAQLLGRFVELCEVLFDTVRTLEAPRPMARWAADLTALADRLLGGPEDGGWEMQTVRRTLHALAEEAAAAGYEGDVPLVSVCQMLDERLEEERPVRGFLTSGVTFCAMVPMRSVPFSVVCILGLGDTQFPRSTRPPSFDLMARSPRPGDRSRRADDRYLFLEAVLAARARLMLFYEGQSIQDNAERPPSVVVSELLDALASACVPPGAPKPDRAGLLAHVVVRHPMQPFSPRYFGDDPDPRLFSYARDYLDGAAALRGEGPPLPRPPLLERPLPEPEPEPVLELEQLQRFFRLPAAELVKRRLGIDLDSWRRDRSDREPMELDGLQHWQVGDTLLHQLLHGVAPDHAFAVLKARGDLPLGTTGVCRFQALLAAAKPLATAARSWRSGEPLPDLEIDHDLGDIRLVGTIPDRWPEALSRVLFSQCSGKHLLQAWIEHLVHCLVTGGAAPTVLVTRGKERDAVEQHVLRPVGAPGPILRDLVALYRLGQCEPLLLFPRASWDYAKHFATTGDVTTALQRSRGSFAADGRIWTEAQDPHVLRLFGDDDVRSPGYRSLGGTARSGSFIDLAMAVFEPLRAHLEGPR